MMPDDIYTVFFSRIEKTNLLFKLLDEDSPIEMTNSIYFKYYFDISTAIEAIIRGIAFEESKLHSYVKYTSEANSESKSYFVHYDELKALIKDINNLYSNISESDFKLSICDKLEILRNYRITKKFINDGTFKIDYESVRRTRNTLAHGLIGINSVDYTKEQLESFLFVLYLLITYYKGLTQTNGI